MNCVICNRPLPDDKVATDRHHLIPKSKRGTETILIHRVCHRKIHSLWTEKELVDYYHTPDRIREHVDMVKFIKWLSKKPDEFYTGTKDTVRRRNKRRR